MMFREDTLYLLLFTGHSNCTWFSYQSMPSGYTNLPEGNKVVRWNSGNTDLLVEDAYTPSITGDGRNTRIANYMSENPPGTFWQRDFGGDKDYAILTARRLKSIIKQKQNKDIQFITINYAHNGSDLDNFGVAATNPDINKGSFSFDTMLRGVQKAKDYADSIGKKIEIPFVYLINGSIELFFQQSCTTVLEYKQILNKTRFDIFSSVRKIINQSYIPKLFRLQEHLGYSIDDLPLLFNAVGKQIQLDAGDKFTPLIMPSYQLSTTSSSHHYGTLDGIKLVSGLSEAIYNELNNNSSVIRPTLVEKTSDTTVKIVTSSKLPLIINTTKGTTTGHGFHHYDGTNFIPAVNVVIDSNNHIVVTFGENMAPESKISYKCDIPSTDTRNGSFISTIYTDTYLTQTNEQYLLSFFKDIIQ